MSTNDGFWQGGMVATPDRLNANMVQRGTLASRPAAGMKGRVYILTDGGDEGKTFYDDGNTWQTSIDVDSTDDTVAALHTLGTGAHDGAAGNHTHNISEDSEVSDIDNAVAGDSRTVEGLDVPASWTTLASGTYGTITGTRAVSFAAYFVSGQGAGQGGANSTSCRLTVDSSIVATGTASHSGASRVGELILDYLDTSPATSDAWSAECQINSDNPMLIGDGVHYRIIKVT